MESEAPTVATKNAIHVPFIVSINKMHTAGGTTSGAFRNKPGCVNYINERNNDIVIKFRQ